MALNFAFTANDKQFMDTLNRIQRGVSETARHIENEGESLESFFNKIRNLSAISFAGIGLGTFVNQIKDVRAYYQDIESTMKVFLGDAEKANEFTEKLKDYAYYNMFEFSDLANASQQLIAYGNNVESVIPTIHKLSEVAVATHVPLEEMVNLFNRAKSTGVVGSQDIASWASKGLILKDVMKEMGTYVEGQTISFKQLNEVLDKVTSEGGLFHGIQDSQMENISANIGQLEDNLSLMFDEMGQYLEKPIYEVLQFGSDVIDHWKEVGAVIAATLASAGVQKGVELITVTVDRTAAQTAYAAEITQLNELLGKKSEEEKTSLQQAVASGQLTQAKADEIEKLREEADAYLKVLEAKEAEAAAELKLADADVSDITSWKEELDAKIEATQNWIEMCEENADAVEELWGSEVIEQAQLELSSLTRERDSVVTELNTATERQNTAARNLNAATTQREAASTAIDTAATTQNTFATKLLTAAKTMLTKAEIALNNAIAANKYMIALAAITALSYGIYKLITYETDAEKAIKSANESVEKQESSMRKEISTLDDLKKKLESSKKGTNEWKNAKDSIVSQFGKYHQGLDDEIAKTGTLASSYDALTKSIRLSAAARAMEQFRNDNDPQEAVDKALEATRKRIADSRLYLVDGNGETRIENGEYVKGKITGALADQVQQAMYEFINGKDLSEFTPKIQNYLRQIEGWDAEIFKARQKTSAVSQGEAVIAKRYGTTVEAIDGVEKNDKTEYDDPRTDKDKIKQDLDAKIKQYDQLKKGTAEALAIKKEIESLEKQLAEYNDYKGEKKKTSGQTAEQIEATLTSAQQKILDLIRQQAEERLRLRQQYETEEWQNRIDLMEDGEAKVLAQMSLDNTKEIASLEDQKQAAVKAEIARQKALFDARQDELAVGNKKYVKQTFNPDTDVSQDEIKAITALYDGLHTQLLQKQTKAEQDRLSAAKDSFNSYLKEYGTYEQQRLAIEEEYNQKIAEAANAGERLMLNAQKDAALAQLDYDQWLNSGDVALAFGDIANLSKQTVTRLIADMEKYRGKVAETFDPEKIQKYEEALANLHAADVENSFGAFSNMVPEYFTKRLSLQKQINEQARIGLELVSKQNDLAMRTDNQRNVVKFAARDAGFNLSDEDIADPAKMQQLASHIATSAANGNKFAEVLQKALEKLLALNGEAADLEKATKSWNGNFSTLKETLANLDGKEKFEAICTAVGSAADMVDNLASRGAELADALGAEGMGEAIGYLGDAMGSVSNIASGFAQGGLVGGIAAAAGELMNWATKLIMAGDAKHQKNIERLQEQIDALQKSYDRLGYSIEDAYSSDASELIEQQNTLLAQQKVLIRQQMAEEEAKKKTDSDKIEEYKEQIEEINRLISDNKAKAKEAIIGEDIKSAISEFADTYASAWKDGTDAAEASMQAVKNIITSALNELVKKRIQPAATAFYDTLAEAMKDGVLTDAELVNLDVLKSQMDALAAFEQAQYEKILNRYRDLDELREELTDISFDSVRDNFKSLLTDMTSSTADFTEDFTDMLRNALIEGLMNTKYDAMLKEWYDDFAEAMNDRTLSDTERDSLRQRYEEIVNQGIADRDAINDIVGGGAYSQSASSGGWESRGQDTADELNGRFTALTELYAIGNDLRVEGNRIAADILATLRSMGIVQPDNGDDRTLLDIKDMMFLSTGYLEDIAKYTKQLIAIENGISRLNNLINQRL